MEVLGLQLRPLDEALESPRRHGAGEGADLGGGRVRGHRLPGLVEQSEDELGLDVVVGGVVVIRVIDEEELEADAVVRVVGVAVGVVPDAPAVAAGAEHGGLEAGGDAQNSLRLGVPLDLDNMPPGLRLGEHRRHAAAVDDGSRIGVGRHVGRRRPVLAT